MPDLTRAQVAEHLSYDKRTGAFVRVKRPKENVGSIKSQGYLRIFCVGKIYAAHRLAWLLTYGEWPDGYLDHINGVRLDNRITNLRLVTYSESNQNRPVFKNNKRGLRGVFFQSNAKKWRAIINLDKKRYHLGYFDTAEDAHVAYSAAAERLHGEYTRKPAADAGSQEGTLETAVST